MESVKIDVRATRVIIQRCMGGGSGLFNLHRIPLIYFGENVNDNATGDAFCPPKQKSYIRCINIEYDAPQIVCNGGTMWIFNFKTENKNHPAFTIKKGSQLKVLGGYVNMCVLPSEPEKQSPMITVDEAQVSIVCSTNMTQLFYYPIRETRNGVTKILEAQNLPKRGGIYWNNFVIPLYRGGIYPSNP